MALITPDVVYPAILAGKRNGELPTTILISTPGINGGPTVRLVPTATRCWRALAGSALDDGVVLQATSYGDSYRWLSLQVSVFTSRYQVEPTGNGYKWWDSDGSGTPERWYKKDGVATAAVPGTSNHGWGVTVDIANASGTRLRWLELNAPRFGWAWETVPEEPWHIRNFTGDRIPAAVLEFEENTMGVWEDPNSSQNKFLQELVKTSRAAFVAGAPTFDGSPYLGNPQSVWLVEQLNAIAANNGGTVVLTDEQLDALADKVATRLQGLTFLANPGT